VVVTPGSECDRRQQKAEREQSPWNFSGSFALWRIEYGSALAFDHRSFDGRRGRRRNRLLLRFSQCRDVLVDRLFFVEADVARVRADKALVKDSPRKLIEFLFFQSAEHTRPDLGAERNVVERDASLLALLSQPVTERSH
jgi:hypothetical protein